VGFIRKEIIAISRNWYGFLRFSAKKFDCLIGYIRPAKPLNHSVFPMEKFLQKEYYNNTIQDYLIVAAIIVFSVLVLKAIKSVIIKRLRVAASKTEGTTDDFIIDGLDRFGLPVVLFGVIVWAFQLLELSDKAATTINTTVTVIITYYILRFLSAVILMLLQSRIRRQEHGEEKIKQLGGLMLVINIFIWIVGIIFLLENLKYDVGAIIAGLGIGGIAIALAAQNILGDLFNYFVIYFDRPFEVGDFIVVDDKSGTVEYLGIKTTRIRALSGEQLIIGNSNLTGSRIHNFKRMINRRVVFTINIDHRTPLDKVKEIPGMLRQIVEEQKPVLFDRAHFATYGDWSLKFEVVYFVLSHDFNKYMDIQQNINFRIREEFEKNDIYIVATPHATFVPSTGQPTNS
jgi:small-conductance mechanosensitive channel